MPKVFISYARADSEFAEKLVNDLRSAGVSLWFDQHDIAPGDRWDSAVENALMTSPLLLVVLSPDSVASQNVMDEVAKALASGKKVVPVLHRPCDVPFRIVRLQYVDLTVSYERGIKQLVTIVGAPPVASALPDNIVRSDPPVAMVERVLQYVPRPKPRLAMSVAAAIAVLSAAAFWWFSETEPEPPSGRSLWVADNSYVYLEPTGDKRQFFLIRPSSDLAAQGAQPGSLLFDGRNINEASYEGKLFLFAGRRCATREYDASGPISNDGQTVTLVGKAPQIDPASCLTTGEQERTLIFNFKHH